MDPEIEAYLREQREKQRVEDLEKRVSELIRAERRQRLENYLLKQQQRNASKKAQTHLIIGDSHAKVGVSNERYRWLARFVAEVQPDVVIDMGDWADMTSLCSYDAGKRIAEGRRIKDDLEVAKDARSIYREELEQCVSKLPLHYAIEGNHEYRITKAVESDPKYYGLYDTSHLHPDGLWEIVPFGAPLVLNGLHYRHHFETAGGKLISGIHQAYNTLRHKQCSSVAGHSHILQYSESVRSDGERLLALVAGCYFEHWEEYAGEDNHRWWRGLVVLRDVKNGYGDIEVVKMNRIRQRYGD